MIMMPAYKKQHYVPQFYLKKFAINNKIQVYNLNSKNINLMNCKDVCASDYFYAKMAEVERGVSQLEDAGNRIITDIIKLGSLSKLTSQNYCILLYFLAFQYSRTLRGKQEASQYFDGIYTHFFRYFVENNAEKFKKEGIDPEYLKRCSIKVNGAVHAFAIKSIMERGPLLIRDLTPILFLNNTKRDFVSSDNPIVLYNSFFNNPSGHFLYPCNSTTGLQSPGLQIFWPLDTKHMLVLYDENFYNFRTKLNEPVNIRLKEDVDALNSLQFFNCSNNILFADISQEANVRMLHSKYECLITHEYHLIDTIRRTKSNGHESEIVINYTKDIDYSLLLSFMYFNMNAKAVDIARDFYIADFADQHFKEEETFNRLFFLGELIVTDGADRVLYSDKPKEDLLEILKRHVSGDWGEICLDEKDRNDKAIEDGSRVLSAYTLSTGKQIIVLTEAEDKSGHRTITRILIPDELSSFYSKN